MSSLVVNYTLLFPFLSIDPIGAILSPIYCLTLARISNFLRTGTFAKPVIEYLGKSHLYKVAAIECPAIRRRNFRWPDKVPSERSILGRKIVDVAKAGKETGQVNCVE